MTLLKKYIFLPVCLFVMLFGLGLFNYAVAAPNGGNDSGQASGGGNSDNSQSGGGNEELLEFQTIQLENPLQIDSLEDLIIAILNIFITLMIPIIVFFIILAGFKYVTAQGNSGKIEEATTTLTYAIIGGVLILGAVAIAEIVKNTVAAF